MQNWPDQRLLDLLRLEIPIIQAPIGGSVVKAEVHAMELEMGSGLSALGAVLLWVTASRPLRMFRLSSDGFV